MSRPLRILVAHNYYRLRGGEDTVAEAEVALLRSRNHEVEFFTRSNGDIEESQRLQLAVDAVWSSRSRDAIDEAILRFRPDVLHAHNTFPVLSPAVFHVASDHRVPVVQTLHNFRLMCVQAMFLREGRVCEDCLGRLPWRGVVRRCYRSSVAQSAVVAGSVMAHRVIGTYQRTVSRFIALNAFCKGKFVQGGLPAARIAVKPNFVEAPAFEDEPRQGGLFVGRLAPEKGLRTLVQAMALVRGARVDVLGEGPDESVGRNVPGLTLHGNASAQTVRAMMLKAAYLLMPSIWYETFGLVVIEAFSCGLPVIASRLGAMAELVADGRTGALFDASSAEDLARKIAWAEANPHAMRRMGEEARREYEAKYTPDINYRQLMAIYDQAIHEVQQGRQ